MRTADLLIALANFLENPNNEAILLAEDNDECLSLVSSACISAADTLKKCAEAVDKIEPKEDKTLTAENIDFIGELAAALDATNDEVLKKQASALDEILMSIGAPQNAIEKSKKANDDRIEALRSKYEDAKKFIDKNIKEADAVKDIKKSDVYKSYRLQEAPLDTRYCPSHPGAQIQRLADGKYKCALDGQVIDFRNGYDTPNGHVPGSSVDQQTKISYPSESYSIFDSRESRLTGNQK